MTLDDLSTALPLHCIAQVSDIIWFVHIDLEDDSGPVLSMVILIMNLYKMYNFKNLNLQHLFRVDVLLFIIKTNRS